MADPVWNFNELPQLQQAISRRRSRRQYLPKPIPSADVARLQAVIDKVNSFDNGYRIVLVTDDKQPFVREPIFHNANNYLALVSDSSDPNSAEKLGYYGEYAVLQATLLGLGTCWVGGTFRKDRVDIPLSENEEICLIVAIGVSPKHLSIRERLIHFFSHRKSKTADQLGNIVGGQTAPDWFIKGMTAVEGAPSAVNEQPVTFALNGDEVIATYESKLRPKRYSLVNLGIAKLHFQLGAGGGVWAWGNNNAYHR